jgi:hypothetical protein
VLVSAVQLSACSSKPSSIDENKPLSSLSMEERHQYCEDHSHFMSSRVTDKDRQKIDCSVAARSAVSKDYASEKATSACQDAYHSCMDMPAPMRATSCDTFVSSTEGCPATVGEADDCAEAQADALEKIAGKAETACKDLGKPLAPAAEPGHKRAKACERLQIMCPKAFGALFAEPALGNAAP